MEFPHIGIIDPRTGELVFKKKGFLDPHEFIAKLTDLMDRFDIQSPEASPAKTARSTDKASPPSLSSNFLKSRESREDRELAAAIRASMESASSSVASEPKIESTRKGSETSAIEGRENSRDVVTKEVEEETANAPSTMPPEPDLDNPTATSIHFRLPSGTRAKRRFLRSDSVNLLYQYVRETVDGARSRSFDIRTVFPPKSLRDAKEKTVEELSLMQSVVIVRFMT
eukprot:g1853.t1